MKRKIAVPRSVYDTTRFIPSAVVVSVLNKFKTPFKVVPLPAKRGWVEYVLDDAGVLGRFSDHYLRNLLMLTYLSNPPEFCYRNFVAGFYPDSKVEVPTSAGIVDVMTDKWVIEVKVADSWKHALGQALAYSHVTGKAPAVALFGSIPQVARDIFLVQGVDIIAL